MSNPNVEIDNPNVVVQSIEETSPNRWEVKIRFEETNNNGVFFFTKGTHNGNGSCGEPFNYKIIW
jgi:hypothetical protein